MKRPLVEAIFELRWGGAGAAAAAAAYPVLSGRFFERVKPAYPVFEPLPSFIPPMPIPGFPVQPQQRYRKSVGGWPVVQLGDGLLSFHSSNDSYAGWDGFLTSFGQVCQWLMESIPDAATFHIDVAALRYLDAIPFDYNANDVTAFLRKSLGLSLGFPPGFFADGKMASGARKLNWQVGFPCHEPAGMAHVSVQLGKHRGNDAIILESSLVSEAQTTIRNVLDDWATAAHDVVVNKIFKTMLQGMREDYPDVFIHSI